MGIAGIATDYRGAEFILEYRDSNLRLERVTWVLPEGNWRCIVKRDGVVVADRTIAGPSTGSQNLPASFVMVEVVNEEGVTYLSLPQGVTFQFGER